MEHVYNKDRVWSYNELVDDGDVVQDIVMNKTEEEILKEYWDHWSHRMKIKETPSHYINRENCIVDWINVHWAWRDKDDQFVLGEE